MKSYKLGLLTGCALAGIGSTHAQAQALNQAAAETAQAPDTLDIVVTARRRAESLQNVPVAIIAVNDRELREKQIANAYDLGASTPGLTTITNGGTRNTPGYTIRGQGASSRSEPSVVPYFADVPLQTYNNIGGNNFQFYDLESVQVLKGPQGTLFGRPTTGGAVLYQPKTPTGEFDGFVDATIGNYSSRDFSSAINIPLIGDRLAIRAAGNYSYHRGYTQNLATGTYLDGRDRSSFRISILAKPTDWLTNMTIFTDSRVNEDAGANVAYRVIPEGSLLDTSPGGRGALTIASICGRAGIAATYAGGAAECSASRSAVIDTIRNSLLADLNRINNGPDSEKRRVNQEDTILRQHTQLFINTTNIDAGQVGFLGDVSLKNIFSASRLIHAFSYFSCCGGNPGVSLSTAGGNFINGRLIDDGRARSSWGDQWSDEVQLSGRIDGRHNWLIGYYHELNYDDPYFGGGASALTLAGALSVPQGTRTINQDIVDNFKSRMTGIFGQTTIDLGAFGLKGLNFTAGYRRSNFRQSFDNLRTIFSNVTGITTDGTVTISPKLNQSADSYTFSLDYRISPAVLLYATTRKGFRPGGINTQVVPLPAATNPQAVPYFKPETVTDYEIGAKTDWDFGGVRGRANLTLFLADFSNVQRSENFIASTTNAPVNQINNIAGARAKGVEFETSIMPAEGVRLDFNYAYLDTYYTKYSGFTAVPSLGGCAAVPVESPSCRVNIDAVPRAAPKHKIGVTARYELPLADGNDGALAVNANLTYQSTIRLTENDLADPEPEVQRGYALANLRLEWNKVMGNAVDLAFFVKNITKKYYIQGVAHTLNSNLGVAVAQYGDPRTIGLQLRARFGASAD